MEERQQQLEDIAGTIAEAIWMYSSFTIADAQRINVGRGWTVADGGYQTGVKLSDRELQQAYAMGQKLAENAQRDEES
jgi:hypothetical protein